VLHADVVGERARITPDRLAVVDLGTGRRLSYRQVDDRAAACARAWRESLGLAPGDRLALLSENLLEFLDHFFAAAKSGIVLVPLGTRLTAAELRAILADCAPRALVYDGAHAAVVRELGDARATAAWVALDERARPGHLAHDDLLSRLPPGRFERGRLGPEAACCLLYTSGTTGRPKGVVLPHRMIVWNACNTALSWQLRDDDVTSIFTPLYHAGGLGAFLTPVLAAGGTVVLHRGFDPAEVWETIERERCTVALGVPTIFRLLAEAPQFASADLRHVRFLISGGAPLPVDLVHAYHARGVVLKQGYGLTEVGVNCFTMTAEDALRKAGSVGRPLMFTEARVADESGREAPDGEVGELLFRGPHVCRGYWNQPEATAAAIDADGWFHTGDLARRDAEGFVTIAGRKKDMFISGGVNVYPAEVEAELLSHGDVADAAVVGVPDDTWGEVGVAFLVARPGAPALLPEALGRFLERRLARFKHPRAYVFVDALPRTAYGKILKAELRDRYLAGVAAGRAAGQS
jgi:fatty-acyl-CoA synthase